MIKIIIEAPIHKGNKAELWEVHRKISNFLKKKNLHSLEIYSPSCNENIMTLEFKDDKYLDLILEEIKCLLTSKSLWKLKAETAINPYIPLQVSHIVFNEDGKATTKP